MAQYKLTYLDITAIGEVSRYLMHYGGIKFEDVRVPFDSYMNKDEYFKELKKELPFGLLPTLEFDGKVITQSMAIARYLATKVGLYGNDSLENLLIDEAAANIDDFRAKFSQAKYADAAIQPQLMSELKSHFIPYYLTKFNTIVGKNDGHFGIPRWNWADILFGSYLFYYNTIVGENILKGYPHLEKLAAELEALPGIRDYLANRPKTVC